MKIQDSPALFIIILSLVSSYVSYGQINGKPGIYIRQKIVNDSVAEISVTTTLENLSGKKKIVEIRCGIWDNKEFITRDIRNVKLGTSGAVSVTQDLDFGMPELWNGHKHPFLYKIILEVIENGKILAAAYQPLGLRKFGFDKGNRFFLNDKVFPLYGVYFQNKANYPDNQDRYKQLKRQLENVCLSGANAVFLPNQLQTDFAYSLCDSLGLIVWGSFNKNIINENETRNIIDFIRQNYNHPSIFFWSFGSWTRQDKSPLSPVDTFECEQLEIFTDLINKEDPGRLTFHESDVWWIPYDSIDGSQNYDRLHWYKARWSEEPVIYIAGKKDTVNQDVLKRIVVYCNLYDPVLEVNGNIINDRKDGSSEIDFSWENVGLKKGINKVRVFARRRGKQIEDTWNFELR